MRLIVQPHKFLKHLTAPFSGATHDQDGNTLPSKHTKSWVFTLGNERKDNHLTFKATRLKGRTINDPVEVSVMAGTHSHDDLNYLPLGEVSTNGVFTPSPYTPMSGRGEIGLQTFKWLLSVSSDEDFAMPDHLEIMCDAKCARCAKPLSNPNSMKEVLGPICRSKVNTSKPAKPKRR